MKEKILTAITTYIQQHGYPPTVREIGEAVGLKSTISVYQYLQRMDTAGIIALGNGPRAITVPGWQFVRMEKPEQCIIAGVEPAESKRPCIGYSRSDTDDEPCEMCKACSRRDGYDPEED